MASLRCLRVTMCTARRYFTIREVVKAMARHKIEAARVKAKVSNHNLIHFT